MALAGGLVGALFHRERTGEAPVVDCSLMASGMWAMQAALVGANLKKVDMLYNADRSSSSSPLTNHYRTSDGRWVALAMLQGDRYWGDFCRLAGRPELAEDQRFATVAARAEHNRECIRELDALFIEHPLEYWVELLSRQEGQWAIAEPVGALNTDEQALANGYLQTVDYGGGRSLNLVSSPVSFDEAAPVLRPAPGLGADTEMVLHEDLEISWERIIELKEIGAIN